MKLLRRILTLVAILWAGWAVIAIVTPRWLVESAMGQPPLGEAVWVRIAGVLGLVVALLCALVSQRLEDVWWWSWAFAALEVGIATVALLQALFGLPDGAAAWPWWVAGGLSAVLAAAMFLGMADAGHEKPFV